MKFKENKISQATNSDGASIKNVVFTVLKEYHLLLDENGKDKDLNDIEKYYTKNNGYFGVVRHPNTNEVIGTFGLFAISDTVCELRKMYLLKEARGIGLGKFILDYSIEIAKEKGFKKITLETLSILIEAITLYKSRGFVEVKPKLINQRVDQAFELDITVIDK